MERTWRIGEVSERTGLTRRTLRHYDDLGLLVPSERSSGDYRLYDEDDLVRLLQIQNLKAIGLGLAEIAEVLGDPSLDAGATLASHLAHLEEQIATEQRLASRLRALAASEQRTWDDVLDVIALTRLQAHGDPMLRLRAALAPRARSTADLLTALCTETDPAVQEVLVWALAQQPDASDAAIDALPSADAERRRLLTRLLGKTGGDHAEKAISGLLVDPEDRVVSAAVAAATQLRPASTAGPITALLGAGRVADADLVDALVAIGEPALEPLLAVLADRDSPGAQAAAEALGRLGAALPTSQEAIAAALVERASSGQREIRLAVVIALAALGEAGRARLVPLASDSDVGGVVRRLLDLHAT
jgi:DNA-binding transcriptional MerR regulator